MLPVLTNRSCSWNRKPAGWTRAEDKEHGELDEAGGRAEFAPSRSAWLAALDDVRKVQAWLFDARYVALLETMRTCDR